MRTEYLFDRVEEVAPNELQLQKTHTFPHDEIEYLQIMVIADGDVARVFNRDGHFLVLVVIHEKIHAVFGQLPRRVQHRPVENVTAANRTQRCPQQCFSNGSPIFDRIKINSVLVQAPAGLLQ